MHVFEYTLKAKRQMVLWKRIEKKSTRVDSLRIPGKHHF